MMKPTTLPRMIGIKERSHSFFVNQSLPFSRMISGRVPLVSSSIVENTSAMANRPTTASTKPTPSCSSGTPMV
ncbi:hypothetical protein D3C83_71140 [compost metagenome]